MLKDLLAILTDDKKSTGYTVGELAARVGASADDVRLALWQLEQLQLIRVTKCGRGESSSVGCEGCPVHDHCTLAAHSGQSGRSEVSAR